MLTEWPVHSYTHVWERPGVLDDTHGTLMKLDHHSLVIPKKYHKRLLNITHNAHL